MLPDVNYHCEVTSVMALNGVISFDVTNTCNCMQNSRAIAGFLVPWQKVGRS